MKYTLTFFMAFCCGIWFSQTVPLDSVSVKQEPLKQTVDKKNSSESDVISDIESSNSPSKIYKLNPTKAGLYSAVLPGLGQFYNKKYWKIPIVWGAVGTGVGIALWNEKQYKRYRDAFVAELNGLPHEFSGIKGVDKIVLGNAQDRSKRQRDYAIGITALIYILNIMDAVVDAHLYEGRKDPDLALSPSVIHDQYSKSETKAGLTLSFRF